MSRQSPTTTTAILSDDAVVDNALSLLLKKEGYTTRVIQEERLLLGLVEGLLEGVHIVLLTPALSNDVRDTLLNVVRDNPKTAAMLVLMLSTTEKEVLSSRTTRVVPRPTPLEDFRQGIEIALTPASQRLLAEGEGQRLVCPEPLSGPQGASSEGASSAPSQRGAAHASPHPEEHYHDKRISLPADKDAELVFLRRIIDEGESRGWKLVSAVKQPGAGVLWVMWDTSGSSSG